MIDPIQHQVKNKHSFIVYYQGFIAVAAVLVFFTKSSVYLERQGIGMPLLWLIAFLFASLPLCYNLLERLHFIPTSMIIWTLAYLALPFISILLSPLDLELQLLEDHIRSVIFLLLMLLLFSQHPQVLTWVKLAIISITVIAVFMYIYEFFNPTFFYLEQHAPGRSSGFYHDGNESAAALIIGMIFTIDYIKPKYRLLYALFILLGIAPTFSRGGMLCWLAVIIFFIIVKIIPRQQLPLLFLSIFATATIVSSQLNNLVYLTTDDGESLFNEGTLARVEFLIDPLGQQDSSSSSRLSYVDESWLKFANKPFLGNGIGSGANPEYISARGTAQRSHNVYLDKMVEYGFLGALIYPLGLIACVWKAEGELKKYAWSFVLFCLVYGIFTHISLSAFFLLLSYAIMANMTMQSRLANLDRKH